MIEVRMRLVLEPRAVHLTEVPFDKLDTVIPTIARWGIGEGEPELYGQFVVTDTEAFFEVVVDDE